MTMSWVNDLLYSLYTDLFAANPLLILCIALIIAFLMEFIIQRDNFMFGLNDNAMQLYAAVPVNYCPNKRFYCKTYNC